MRGTFSLRPIGVVRSAIRTPVVDIKPYAPGWDG